jgi:Asp-tRNA(Asn)/Glu-tRNA(Gln) amidotransferase A subunit family amidase
MGLFGRSVTDIAALRSVLTGMNPAIPVKSLKNVRIGVCRTPSWDQAQPETVNALDTAGRKLAQAGAKLQDAELPAVFEGINQSFNVISGVEALRAMAAEARDHLATMNHWIKDSLTAASKHEQGTYDKAQLHAVQCQRALAEIFTRCDILITPSTAGEAIADVVSVSNSAFNRIWTLMHVPCVTIPAFAGPNGMPVGLQLVGPVGSDDRVIALSQAVADALQ